MKLKPIWFFLFCVTSHASIASNLPEIMQLPAREQVFDSKGRRVGEIVLSVPSDIFSDMRRTQDVEFSVDADSPFSIAFDEMKVEPGEKKIKKIEFGDNGEARLSVSSLDGVEGQGLYKVSIPATKMITVDAIKTITYQCETGSLNGDKCLVVVTENVSPIYGYSYDQVRCDYPDLTGWSLKTSSITGTSASCTFHKFKKYNVGPPVVSYIESNFVSNMGCEDYLFIATFEDVGPATNNPSPGARRYKMTRSECKAEYDLRDVSGTFHAYSSTPPQCPSGSYCFNGYNGRQSSVSCPSGSYKQDSKCIKSKNTYVEAKKIEAYKCDSGFDLVLGNKCRG